MKVICYKMTSEAFKAREIKIKNVLNTGTNKQTLTTKLRGTFTFKAFLQLRNIIEYIILPVSVR